MAALIIGMHLQKPAQAAQNSPAAAAPTPAISVSQSQNIPYKGSIQVLNGCGVTGAADQMAAFLRDKNFDVKKVENAQSWNYPATMVVSRTENMALARELGKILKTDKVVLVRNGEQLYDVTIVTGPDFRDRTGEKR
ncbi:MAG: LytR C-terminal domain-containing protein [Chitinispirillia bacterium]|nr:LytR C-terminal domain-containing protein [Chitinispirillia bacterium]